MRRRTPKLLHPFIGCVILIASALVSTSVLAIERREDSASNKAFSQVEPTQIAPESPESLPQQTTLIPLEDITAVAAGAWHTCALTIQGGVKCWGMNSNGQLGDGTNEDRTTPVDVVGLTSGVKAISAGFDFTCALANEGGVKCWGENLFGQLGNSGGEEDQLTPVDVSGLESGVKSIATGHRHACAVTFEGDVRCWGDNNWGKVNGLHQQYEEHFRTPVEVFGLYERAAKVITGARHSCIVTDIGEVLCWGSPGVTSATRFVDGPVQVPGLDGEVVKLGAGFTNTCAYTNNGSFKCWGDNDQGQLGDGTQNPSPKPVELSDLEGQVIAIDGGVNFTCALMDESVHCWGDNASGQLGDGTTIRRLTPVKVVGIKGSVTALATGYTHSCAVVEGEVWCWGDHFGGRLGEGVEHEAHTPVKVIELQERATAITAGAEGMCALLEDGSENCWGRFPFKELIDTTADYFGKPTTLLGPDIGVTALTIGNSHGCALLEDGGVQCWGSNYYGQLGDGTTESQDGLVKVVGLEAGVEAIDAGPNHTCALTSNSGVKCWGENQYGQLGDGTTTDRSEPVDVKGLTSGVTAISTGWNYTCALLEPGSVMCWGYNNYGRLGDGSNTNHNSPVNVFGLGNGVSAIATGDTHTCALTETGGVKCWGRNSHGELGVAEIPFSETPVDATGLSDSATEIVLGDGFSCALTTGGGVKCWGNNDYGQLGDASTVSRETAENVQGLTGGIIAIAVGEHFVCALTVGGEVQCWGNNSVGQLGDGSVPRTIPVQVMEAVITPSKGFRQTGPLVSELTTYIPTPLDISTEPAVVGTNLGLAAVAMISLSIAIELLNKILEERESFMERAFRPAKIVGRLLRRLERALGAQLSRPSLIDGVKLVGIILFYGLVFSLLEPEWDPLTLTGFYLFVSMTIAFGVVGIAADLSQWRATRRWGVPSGLTLRPANLLLAIASTSFSRILSLAPGIMFGTPEAFDVDENALDEQRKRRLMWIAVGTLLAIGLGVWFVTTGTALLQKVRLPEPVSVLIGGLEALLLVVFAVAIENLFVQLLAFPGSIGRSLMRWNRWAWGAALLGITFVFYHTLLNPKGKLAESLQTNNVRYFFLTIAVFVIATLVVWLITRIQYGRAERKAEMPVPVSIPVDLIPGLPEASNGILTAVPTGVDAEVEAVPEKKVTCADCEGSFTWEQAYNTQNTPGSEPHIPPGHGIWCPRAFCPLCGALVAQWHISRVEDYNEWSWFGGNATINAGCPMPPNPGLYWGKQIPRQCLPYYDEHRLDVRAVEDVRNADKPMVEAEKPITWQDAYDKTIHFCREEDIPNAQEQLEKAVAAGLPEREQAIVHSFIGEIYIRREENVEAAYQHCQRSVELDPTASWKSHFILSLIHEALGETEKGQTAYRDAKRLALTMWFTPQVEQQVRQTVSRWASGRPSEEELMVEPLSAYSPPSVAQVPTTIPEDAKKCPMCAEQIKLEARICRFCRTRFDVSVKGYCTNCHAVVAIDENDRCIDCGNRVIDQHVESKWLGEESAQLPFIRQATPLTPSAAETQVLLTRPGRPGCVIAYALLLFLMAGFIAFMGVVGELSGATREAAGELTPWILISTLVLAFLITALAIGLWRLKNWARVAIIVLQSLGIAFGVFGVIATFTGSLADLGYPGNQLQTACGELFGLAIQGSILYWFVKNGQYFD